MAAFLTIVSSLSAFVGTAAAEPDVKVQFNIPAQNLDSALEAYAATSGFQILYESDVTTGRRSGEVVGLLTNDVALRALLSVSGLDFDYTGERSFTLVRGRRQVRLADFNPFLGYVQQGVLDELCRRAETRPGAFRLALQFRIAESGRLEKPSLLTSTGLIARDAAIAEALARVAFNRAPPAGMPQPVTMVLSAARPGDDDECTGPRR